MLTRKKALDQTESDSPCTSTQTSPEEAKMTQLSQEQLNRIEVNRKRALEIREQKEKTAKMFLFLFYLKINLFLIELNRTKLIEPKKMIDTGAGFFLDQEELVEQEKTEIKIVETPRNNS